MDRVYSQTKVRKQVYGTQMGVQVKNPKALNKRRRGGNWAGAIIKSPHPFCSWSKYVGYGNQPHLRIHCVK